MLSSPFSKQFLLSAEAEILKGNGTGIYNSCNPSSTVRRAPTTSSTPLQRPRALFQWYEIRLGLFSFPKDKVP